jgi:hypothetical protein
MAERPLNRPDRQARIIRRPRAPSSLVGRALRRRQDKSGKATHVEGGRGFSYNRGAPLQTKRRPLVS